jgi:hypothetical protein
MKLFLNLVQALERDGYRCMITGKYDADYVKENPHIVKKKRVAPTECAHIFPESLGFNVSQEKKV